MADVCRYYTRPAKPNSTDRHSRCELTRHACLKGDGTGYRDCGPFLAAEHRAKRLSDKGRQACLPDGGGKRA